VDEDDEEMDPIKQAKLQEVLDRTGHSQTEWELLIVQLMRPEATWDWSKIEVLERRREEDRGKTPGVFAAGRVSKKNPQSAKPVFNKWDVIGPLGGTMRRRMRAEEIFYQGRKWVLHDPNAYELGLRAKTTELSVEPLVLDLTCGNSQNRLRHLADARNDPLNLRELLGLPGARPSTAEGLGRPRTAMPRPRSRPHSPMGLAGAAWGEAQASPRADEEATPREFNATASTHDFTQTQPSLMGSPTSKSLEESASVKAPRTASASGVAPGEHEATEAEEAANVKICEILYNGWPYVFVVAKRNIMPGEELMVDLGAEHWLSSRFVLERLRDVNLLGRDLILGTKTDEEIRLVEEEPLATFPERKPIRRAQSKGDAQTQEV